MIKKLARLASICAVTVLALATAHSQTLPAQYPGSGRVMIVVPFAPGGATDIIARLLADELGKRW